MTKKGREKMKKVLNIAILNIIRKLYEKSRMVCNRNSI